VTLNTTSVAAKDGDEAEEEAIPAATLAAIVAAVAAFLSTHVRIRSVDLAAPSGQLVSRWTRQGRTSVHASHNPRLKR
jgi:hypothetical protein